ncbi:diguanylate cyclase [Pseudoalteromonas marina]|uniref:diguanylate cyclase n=1 Tax=Pseudoalteromonas marina TaxID=267375 RepID=UPI0027327207|nr:diguanylate cyclase [Pseudoalteromonas marina]MDP2487288.1 diguanylate cyclase [Pseudoalteromonas marina]
MNGISDLNFKNLLEYAQVGVIIHNWDTSIVYINPIGLQLLNLDYEQAIGRDIYDPHWTLIDEQGNLMSVDDYPVNIVKATKNKVVNKIIGVVGGAKKDISWFMANAYFEGHDDDKNFIVVTITDISDAKQQISFQDVVENTQDMVVITDAKNIKHPEGPKIIYVNKAFEVLTGYTSAEVIGETPRILQGDLTDSKGKQRIYAALEHREEVTETLLNYDVRGRPYWVEMNIIPLKNKFDEVTHFAAIQRDVSKSKFQTEQLEKRNKDLKELKVNLENLVQERTFELQQAKSQLEKIAFFDPLTGIPNRRFFSDQVNKLVKGSVRRGGIIAFGLFDVDNFKAVNDTYGHDVGDRVLVELANILTHILRIDDVFCRFGGEEFAFAVILKEVDDAEPVAEKLINAIRNLKVPVEGENTINVTVSMGLNVVSPNNSTDIDDEIKKSDAAMYQVKKSGKDRYKIIHES